MTDRDTLLKILDLTRWAPSGDNTQPWRFEIVADDWIAIHGFDTRREVLYDFEGRASHMAHGALLETLRLAATTFGLAAQWTLREGTPDTAPIYDVRLAHDPAVGPDPLAAHIRSRTVQRRPMKTTPLTSEQRCALAEAPGPGFEVVFFESFAQRRQMAGLLWDNAKIRLTCPEAYAVHRDVIEWNARFSEDRIPDQAVGVDPLTARLMRWVMQSWERVDFFNRYLMGTVAPRVQLDYLPGIYCAAHVLIAARTAPRTLEDFVAAGRSMQRFWLVAHSVGLHMQPEMTPVIFRWYARAGAKASKLPEIDAAIGRLADRFERCVDTQGTHPVILARVGVAALPRARSTRRPLDSLMWEGGDARA